MARPWDSGAMAFGLATSASKDGASAGYLACDCSRRRRLPSYYIIGSRGFPQPVRDGGPGGNLGFAWQIVEIPILSMPGLPALAVCLQVLHARATPFSSGRRSHRQKFSRQRPERPPRLLRENHPITPLPPISINRMPSHLPRREKCCTGPCPTCRFIVTLDNAQRAWPHVRGLA